MIMRERKKEKETHGGQSAEDMVRKSYARMNKSFGCSMILWYNYAGKEKQVAENTCSLIKSSLYAFFFSHQRGSEFRFNGSKLWA